MTVRELIEKLGGFDPDLEVYIDEEGYGHQPLYFEPELREAETVQRVNPEDLPRRVVLS